MGRVLRGLILVLKSILCNSSESKNGNDSKLHIQAYFGNKTFVLDFFKRKKMPALCREKQMNTIN